MDLENRLRQYKESVIIELKMEIKEGKKEEKIRETVGRGRRAYFMAEEERMLSYHDFLWMQLKIIRKRWWIFQFLLLLSVWFLLMSGQDDIYVKRVMGIAASLFVILVIPELWKNKSWGAMEIEAASYYSLRQIYAARMLLFGIADLSLITVFCGTISAAYDFTLWELAVQFLFPLCVTACICFGILCSRRFLGEGTAIILCLVWAAVWMSIALSEWLYAAVTIPLWCILLGGAVLFLAFMVSRILKNCNKYLEVSGGSLI